MIESVMESLKLKYRDLYERHVITKGAYNYLMKQLERDCKAL